MLMMHGYMNLKQCPWFYWLRELFATYVVGQCCYYYYLFIHFRHTGNIGYVNHNLQFVHYITYNIWTSAHNSIKQHYQIYSVIRSGNLLLYLDILLGMYLYVRTH